MLLMGFGMAYWQHGSDIGLPAGWGGTIALLADSGVTPLVGQIEGGLGTLVRVLLIIGEVVWRNCAGDPFAATRTPAVPYSGDSDAEISRPTACCGCGRR